MLQPIPDRLAPGLMTYDAKAPEMSFPPIEFGNDGHDHFIDPEERLRLAMARQ